MWCCIRTYCDVLKVLQNLRDEVAMDVDGDEEGTQGPKEANDYGIEVDFEGIDDEEREVRDLFCLYESALTVPLWCRRIQLKLSQNLTRPLRNSTGISKRWRRT